MKTKTLLKKIATIGTLCVLAVSAHAVNWTNYPPALPSPGDTFIFGVLTTNQFGVVTNAQITTTNLAGALANNPPFTRVVNPLVSGVNYTSPPMPGWLTVNLIYTNSSSAWLTNLTTGANQFCGSVLALGTNYESVYLRTASNNVVLFTTKVGVLPILSSQWQP